MSSLLSISVPIISQKVVEAAPYIITTFKNHNKYGKVGDTLNVSVDVAVFGTAHFQLIHHYTHINAMTKKVESGVKIMAPTEAKPIGPVVLNGKKIDGALRYRVIFTFKNLTEYDFGSYTIMVGNTFGYDVSEVTVIKRRQLPVVL